MVVVYFRLLNYAIWGALCQEPAFFTTSPALAIPKTIAAASIDGKQVDFCEINQAFAVSFLWLRVGSTRSRTTNICFEYCLWLLSTYMIVWKQ